MEFLSFIELSFIFPINAAFNHSQLSQWVGFNWFSEALTIYFYFIEANEVPKQGNWWEAATLSPFVSSYLFSPLHIKGQLTDDKIHK